MTQPVRPNVMNAPVSNDEDDQDSLYVQAAREDPEGFARLYDQYVKPLYRYLLSKTGNVAEAEDLTSQTFLSALENLRNYRHTGYFSAWLFGIAHHKWVDFYRRQKRPLPGAGWQPEKLETDFLQGIIQDEKAHLLGDLVKKLPEDDRELLQLRLVGELDFGEIARCQGKSEAAVKTKYYRLVDRMKKEMERIYG